MRFSHEIINQILKELEKVPNVRYVCSKVGIDHSTFYRWVMRYPSFNKQVRMSIHLGKQGMSGLAESVIIKGIQNGEHKSAAFWLSHNDPQYMQRDKGTHYSLLLERELAFLRKPIEYDGSNFETLFKFLDEASKLYEHGLFTQLQKSMTEYVCGNRKELIEVCYASYEKWKLDKTKEKEWRDTGEDTNS